MAYRMLFTAVAIVACLTGCASNSGTPSSRVRGLLGDQAVSVLSNANKVDVFRVQSGLDENRPIAVQKAEAATRPALGQVDVYAITARAPSQGTEFARRLAAIVLAETTYRWDVASGCIFQPGVAFRVFSGDSWCDVIICFHCGQLAIVVPQPQGPPRRIFHDFADRAALVRLVKEALPNDAEIQGLDGSETP